MRIICYEISGTDKAMLVSMLPKSRDPSPEGVWVPRSQIEHVTRHPEEPGEWRKIEITIPEWLAEKKGFL